MTTSTGKERWKPFFDGVFEISNHGNARKSRNKKLCTKYISKDGYITYRLQVNYIAKEMFAHVLVALAFIGPKPTPKHEVNHKNLIKDDNYYRNLEWCTHKKNMEHARKNGVKFGFNLEDHPRAKLTKRKARKIRKLRKKGWTLARLGKKFKVNSGTISCLVSNKTWVGI